MVTLAAAGTAVFVALDAHSPASTTTAATTTQGSEAQRTTGIVTAELVDAFERADLPRTDPTWDPAAGLTLTVDDDTGIFAGGTLIVIATDDNGMPDPIPSVPVLTVGSADPETGQFTPKPGLSPDAEQFMHDQLDAVGATEQDDGSFLIPAGAFTNLPTEPCDQSIWIDGIDPPTGWYTDLATRCASRRVEDGGWTPDPLTGAIDLSHDIDTPFGYAVPDDGRVTLIDVTGVMIFGPGANGELEAVGGFRLPGSSGSIDAYFEPNPGYSGSLDASTAVLAGIPGVEPPDRGCVDPLRCFKITWNPDRIVTARTTGAGERRPNGEWCVEECVDFEFHGSVGIGAEDIDPRSRGSGGLLNRLGSVFPDGFEIPGESILDNTGIAVGDVAEWAWDTSSSAGGAMADYAVDGTTVIYQGLEAGWNLESELIDDTLDWAADHPECVVAPGVFCNPANDLLPVIATTVGEALETVATNEWVCPIMVTGGLSGYQPTYGLDPGDGPYPADGYGVPAAEAARLHLPAGTGAPATHAELLALARAWMPRVEYSQFEFCGRVLRVLAKVLPYREDGSLIEQPPFLDDAVRVEIQYTLFFEVDAGRFGILQHAGDNEGFVIGLERGATCRGTTWRLAGGFAVGHKDEPPFLHLSESDLALRGCPSADAYRIYIAEGKHTVYFSRQDCRDENVAGIEECDRGLRPRAYDLSDRVELWIGDPALTCSGGIAAGANGYAGPAWPPPNETYRQGGESVLFVRGEDQSYYCQARGAPLCDDPENRYHVRDPAFQQTGAACDLVVVPSVLGLQEPEAMATLAEAGLSGVIAGTWVYGVDTAPEPMLLGTIIDQDPDPGSTAVAGSTVDLYRVEAPSEQVSVTTGTTSAQVTVPDYHGWSRSSAVADAASRGFDVYAVAGNWVPHDDPWRDKVVSQSLPAGSKVAPGSTLTLYYFAEITTQSMCLSSGYVWYAPCTCTPPCECVGTTYFCFYP